jgi:hypothetical protein
MDRTLAPRKVRGLQRNLQAKKKANSVKQVVEGESSRGEKRVLRLAAADEGSLIMVHLQGSRC